MDLARIRPALRLAPAAVIFAALAAAAPGCSGEADVAELRTQALTASLLPASPTNAHADDPAAAALGQRLFNDKRLSVDGTIACASCHDPAQGFSDARPFSVGVRGQLGGRHAMPITAAAFQPFLLWDGRADALWSQPIKAIENEKEMDLTRVELARRVTEDHKDEYEAVFGALPSLDAAPSRGKPGMAEWDAMPATLRHDVDRVAANVGKALEAFERTVTCGNTRFDRWTRGEVQLSTDEQAGAQAFAQSGCPRCHSGPAFSDGAFHNVGIPSTDRGRAAITSQLVADTFNGVGPHSDDLAAGQKRLALVASETGTEGAFCTASLRGVGQRTFFGHASHQATIKGFILDVYRGGRGRARRAATVGTLDPKLDGVFVRDEDADSIVAFLHTLDCPAPATLTQ